jgi:hypothetical protein
LFVLLSILIILSGIRWEVGTDWNPYYTYFLRNDTWKEYNNGQFEILYAFLNFIIKTLFNSYSIFLLVLGILVILLKYASIEKIALYPALTFFLFYCFSIGDIFPVRQTLAISVLMTSIYFIHQRKKIPFVFLVILAVCFHLSAGLWIFAYSIYHKKISSMAIYFFLLVSFMIGILGSNLYVPLLNTMAEILGPSGNLLGRILVYLNGKYDDGSYSLVHNILAITKRIILVPIFLILRKKMFVNTDYAYGLINLYVFGNIFYLFFSMNMNFAPLQRMSTPFILLEILLLPIVLRAIKTKYMRFNFLILLLVYGLTKLYTALNGYPEAYVPYKSILG